MLMKSTAPRHILICEILFRSLFLFFFFNDTATTEIYTLSLHDALPIYLLAVCIQHEIDHLDGKLFVDYLSALKRNRIRKKLEKQKKADIM